MPTNFPTSLDSLTNPAGTDDVSVVDHAAQHSNANDAIEALEAKVGVNSSAVITSLDYLLKNASSSNPGHRHTTAHITGLATVATTGAYSDLSGAPTIPSQIFNTIAVSGQSNVVADSTTDTLTLAAGSNIAITTDATTDTVTIAATGLVTDHGALTGLSDDDHAQYALLAGRAGGQTLKGGTGAGDDLHLQTTSNASKGTYFLDELTSNGFVKTTGSNGELTIDTSTYLTTGSAASTYVPYSGATTTLDLGAQKLQTDRIDADSTSGLSLYAANGTTQIGNLGASNTANVTWYGSHNYDAATASTIASFGASKTLSSLSTSTYPDLTELSYVKGVTSAIQTQLGARTLSAVVPSTAPSAGQVLVGNAGGTAYAPSTISGSGATISLASTGVVTISGIANASLSNSAITIAGTSTALGSSITQDTITGLGSTGIVKRTGANTLAIATPGTDYLTGNQTITLSGDVSGSGTTGITCTLATVGATKGGTGQTTYTLGDTLYSSASNTLSKLAGNTTTTKKFLRQTGDGVNSAAPAWDTVTSSDVGLGNVENTALSTWAGSANITTLGTISTGTWSATTVAVNKGGTGQTTYTDGQLLIGNTTGNTLAKGTLTAPAAGISITNGAGSITFGLANDLSAVEGLASNGLAARTATDTWAVRTITGGGGVTVTNGGGVAGNPTLGVSALQSMWIPASGIRPSATGGCAAHATSTVGVNRPDRSYLAFDTAGAEEAQFSVAFPKGWDEGTITAVFYWMHPATATNFDVIWGIEGAAFSNDDAINTAWGGQVTVTDTGGTTDDVYVSNTTSAITIGGTPAVGDVCYFRIMRRGVDAGDNLAVDAWLLGVKLFYTINTLDDT